MHGGCAVATVERTGTGYRVRQFIDGKLKTKARCTTRVEALAVQRRLEEDERVTRVPKGLTLSLSEVVKRWQAQKVAEGNDPLHTGTTAHRVALIAERHNWHSTAAVTPAEAMAYRQAGEDPRAGACVAAVLNWASENLEQFVHPRTLVLFRPGKSGRKPPKPLLTHAQVAEAERIASSESADAGVLVHCLSTYGWRPITAARMTVADFDAVNGTITCKVKGGDVVRHLLLPETIGRMRWIVKDAAPSDPLFRSPITGKGWNLIGSGTISRWSYRHLKLRVYNLKRYAISTMLNHGISPQDIAAFTGHRVLAQILKYARTNASRQEHVLGILGKSAGKKATKVEQ